MVGGATGLQVLKIWRMRRREPAFGQAPWLNTCAHQSLHAPAPTGGMLLYLALGMTTTQYALR